MLKNSVMFTRSDYPNALAVRAGRISDNPKVWPKESLKIEDALEL